MKYEDFLKKLSEMIKENNSPDNDIDTHLYYEGFTSDDPEMLALIRECNMKYSGIESDTLVTDFIVKKSKTDGTVESLSAKKFYEETNTETIDTFLKKMFNSRIKFYRGNPDEEEKKKGLEELKESLIIRPLNYALHSKRLKGCIYKKIGDFALVLYQYLGKSKDIFSSSLIHRAELSNWGLEGKEDELIMFAIENTAKLFPACTFNYKTNTEVDLLRSKFTRRDITFGGLTGRWILISTFNTTNGAVALFYPGVVEKLMDIMGGPFEAVFMNINDVMIFPLNDPAAKMFQSTARDSSKLGEMLSVNRYRCDQNGLKKL